MATWEDGPEYAPFERPASFAHPDAAPLGAAPPVVQAAAAAPKDRPAFADPPVPVAPLATLLPRVPDQRNPSDPFDVVSSTLTTDSGWGGVHWSAPAGRPALGSMTGGPLSSRGPATGGSGAYPPPDQQLRPTPGGVPVGLAPPPGPTQPLSPTQPMSLSGAAPVPGGYPSPGTPEWFGPGAYGQPPDQRPARPAAVLDAATPGLCICLLLGGLVWVLAPVMLGVAAGLSGRVKVAREEVRRVFAIGVGLCAVVAALAALFNETGFTGWWRATGITALLVCWALLVATAWLVRRGLTDGGDSPPRRATWG